MSPRVTSAIAGVWLLCAGLASDSRAEPWTRTSFYVPMRDGVPIAVDLYLPEGASDSAKLPAIVRFTRYWRAPQFRWFIRPFKDEPWEIAQRFLANGYAWLDVDVRGSGASGGVQKSLWADDEVADYGEVIDWIVRQPWSSGAVGATGDSYDGTAAELAATTGRPALTAIPPRFSLFDASTDVGWPGGVHLVWFTENWGKLDDALDRGHLQQAFAWWIPLFVAGPRPVDGPDGAKRVTAAQAGHAANFDVSAAARAVTFREDLQEVSPCCGLRRKEIEASQVPVLSISGWWDGAYANAAIKRFNTYGNPESRLVLGPWNHGGDQDVDPNGKTRPSEYDHAAELLAFFDRHLKNRVTPEQAPIHYFTSGEGRWHESRTWPPAHTEWRTLRFGAHLTSESAPVLKPDPEATTGTSTRWHALATETWTQYADRNEQDRHNLVYQTEPLPQALTATGHPVVHLVVVSDQPDATVFAYLEDVAPDGRVGYVSEGQLRALHRKQRHPREAPYTLRGVPYHSYAKADAAPLVPGKPAELVFELQPISHRWQAGHRLRLALANGDRDQFASLPATLTIGAESRLELPVVPEVATAR
jgi:putative CocE/NonD family hydrolase